MPDHRDNGSVTPSAGRISISMEACREIGALAYYLDQVRRNLLEVNDQLRGTTRRVPVVLHDLRDVVRMTEEAASRVLDETEALVEDSRAAARLVTEARAALGASGAGLAEPLLDQLDTLVERGNRRAIEIMSALEFQDLTSQKVQRAFEVLEEVATRLTRIHNLVTLREEAPGPPPPAEAAPAESPAPDGQPSGQDLADEILQRFRR